MCLDQNHPQLLLEFFPHPLFPPNFMCCLLKKKKKEKYTLSPFVLPLCMDSSPSTVRTLLPTGKGLSLSLYKPVASSS